MASKTISQRITLEGSDDIKKQLQDLGKAGEASFKQIQTAAQNTKIDPASANETKQAFDRLGAAGAQLGTQFKALVESVVSFGSQGTKSALDVASGLQKTAAAAEQVGSAMGQASQQIGASSQSASAKLISTATAFKLAAAGIVGAIAAIASALTKGAVETGSALADQAEKLKLTTAQWLELRKAIAAGSLSVDDFQKSISKLVGLAADAAGGIARLGDSTLQAVKLADGSIVILHRFNDTMTDTKGKASEAATELAKLGVSMKTIASGDNLAIMREAALAINNMTDPVKQAAAGVKLFGDNWKETVKALLAGVTATVELPKTLAEVGKASRDLTAQQVDDAKKVEGGWEDLKKAIRATKDQIGAVFLGGALAQTEWLTKLVDGSRELLRIWLGLSDQKRATFAAAPEDSAAETAFKVLIAVGQQLAGIWRDVLVPAGAALLGIVEQVAANFEDVSKSQVGAFFITAAIAVTALAVAFKGIGLVLSPFTALISLFIGFGPILIPLIALVVLFWDQIKEGATNAAALIPGPLAQIRQAIKALFSGDFAGFWTQFSEAAVAAFQAISQEAQKTPWVKEFVDSIKQIGVELPAAILLVITAFLALRRSALAVAPIVRAIFGAGVGGAEVTGTGVILLGLIGQLTGILPALASIATITAASITALWVSLQILGAGLSLLVATFGLPWAALIVAVAAAAGAIAIFWDDLVAGAKRAADAVTAFIQAWVTTPIGNAWQWIVDTFNSVVSSLSSAIDQATALITSWVTTPVGNAWQWIKDTFKSIVGSLLGGSASTSSDSGGFAGGGLLGGRGTGTSDSNLAWVSRGEYIMPARAVAQPGVLAFLEALRRSGGNLRRVLDGMGRFALGGLVPRPIAYPGLRRRRHEQRHHPVSRPAGDRRPARLVRRGRGTAQGGGAGAGSLGRPQAEPVFLMPAYTLLAIDGIDFSQYAVRGITMTLDADRPGDEPGARLPRRAGRHLAGAVPAVQGHDHLHRP